MPYAISRDVATQMRRKKKKSNPDLDTPLQITSMIDMLMIILIFLLKTVIAEQSSSAQAHSDINLPKANANAYEKLSAATLIVAPDKIELNDKLIVMLNKGRIPKNQLKESSRLIQPLFSELNRLANTSKEALQNERKRGRKKALFEGKIVLEADESTSSRLIQRILYTAARSGYHDLKLAVKQKNE
jgi:biopolymer transport protein ExbD